MLGLPHRTPAIPPSPSAGGLGRTFTSMCFSVTFLGAFANSVEMLQGSAQVGNGSSGRGGFPLPEKTRFVAAFAASFVVEFAAVSPLPSPAVFECPRGSRALPVVALRQHLQTIFSISRSRCFPMLRAHLRKAPGVSIVTLLALQCGAGAGLLFALQISNNRCGRRGREVPRHAAPGRASPLWREPQ